MKLPLFHAPAVMHWPEFTASTGLKPAVCLPREKALLWPHYAIGQATIFLCCGFFFLSIFFSSLSVALV